MNLLESEHIANIEQRIVQSGIEDESLKVDLMDHMCCLIEERLAMGNSFDHAFGEVMDTFKVSRLTAIKEETEFLTKSNIIMKKRTIIIGLVATLMIVTGAILKSNHMLGANITLMVGFGTLAFGFVMINLLDRFQYINEGAAKWWHLTGHTGLIILIIGIALKILHQPGGNVVTSVGMIMVGLAFLVISSSKSQLKSQS